jgi:protein-L-isoaspartate(D-aspartate) O-methyltransferase
LTLEQLAGIGMTSQRTRDRMMQRLQEQGIRSLPVLDLMRSIPRHIFLDEALAQRAYEDSALPIGYQQTLSQPYIVARMTELLFQTGTRTRILEIGTGSGYQSAVLAKMPGVQQVLSVERIQPLQEKARQRLRLLKIHNVQLRLADGGMGWPEQAPFDGILSAAAPREVPQELLDQLADGGRLVIPVGEDGDQQLMVFDKIGDEVSSMVIEPVRFVPLLSGVVKK